jgi:hypothetical protein
MQFHDTQVFRVKQITAQILQLVQLSIAGHNITHSVWHLGRQTNHLSIQTKLDNFFKPALLRSKISTTCTVFL